MTGHPLSLVCPRCRARVAAGPEGAVCQACSASYPVRDGVLHMVAGRVGAAGYDPHYFPSLAAIEREHYWFASRRQVVRDVLRSAVPDLSRRALFDLGCGTGGLLQFLGDSGIALAGACDAYPESLAIVRRLVDAPLVLVDEGRFPPLGSGYGLVSLFDVLEHIDDDTGTLRHIFSVLEPGGVLVVTVPAHPFLFDEMDELAHHRRRYRLGRARPEATGRRVRGAPAHALHGSPRAPRGSAPAAARPLPGAGLGGAAARGASGRARAQPPDAPGPWRSSGRSCARASCRSAPP